MLVSSDFPQPFLLGYSRAAAHARQGDASKVLRRGWSIEGYSARRGPAAVLSDSGGDTLPRFETRGSLTISYATRLVGWCEQEARLNQAETLKKVSSAAYLLLHQSLTWLLYHYRSSMVSSRVAPSPSLRVSDARSAASLQPSRSSSPTPILTALMRASCVLLSLARGTASRRTLADDLPSLVPSRAPLLALAQKLQAMDNSHVALVSLALNAPGFVNYRCDRDM